LPVKTTEAYVCGCNFFTHALAHEQVTNEEAKERRTVLAEAAVLKKYAVYHSNVSFEIDRSSWGIH